MGGSGDTLAATTGELGAADSELGARLDPANIKIIDLDKKYLI